MKASIEVAFHDGPYMGVHLTLTDIVVSSSVVQLPHIIRMPPNLKYVPFYVEGSMMHTSDGAFVYRLDVSVESQRKGAKA